tara:strand:- start:944 stop:1201 length:258 start_codon:yes stop_codon:yes gene_type:complete
MISQREARIILCHLMDVRDDIECWSQRSVDFIDQCNRVAENYDEWIPSPKQAKWLCRLHIQFVDEDGIGADVLDEIRASNDFRES